jgi:surface antigen
MDANQVRAYVALKFPGVLNSPLAQAMHGASAMAQLEASDANRVILLADARAHANACLAARDGWTVETLGHNIESAFGMDLDADECDEIARAAIAKAIK